jgi:hypothetical protein
MAIPPRLDGKDRGQRIFLYIIVESHEMCAADSTHCSGAAKSDRFVLFLNRTSNVAGLTSPQNNLKSPSISMYKV